jgi:hypothetical protein
MSRRAGELPYLDWLEEAERKLGEKQAPISDACTGKLAPKDKTDNTCTTCTICAKPYAFASGEINIL